MFYEEIKKVRFFFCKAFCLLKILYNSKFILMATSLGTNAVVVTRVHCNKETCCGSVFGRTILIFCLHFFQNRFAWPRISEENDVQ